MRLEAKRWLLLACCTVIYFFMGQTYAWSVFVKPFAAHFQWSVADAMVAFSIFHSMTLPGGFVGAVAQHRWNVKPKSVVLVGGLIYGLGILLVGFTTNLTTLWIGYGFMGGGGFGLMYSTILPCMVKYFPDRRGLACGILVAGVGAAPLVWAPIGVYMIGLFGVLAVFKILGVLSLIVFCTLGFVVKNPPDGFIPEGWVPSNIQQAAMEVENKDWLGMLKDPLYYTISLGVAMMAFSGLMIISSASPILQTTSGFTPAVAAYWVGILGLCNFSGRLFWGYLSDKFGRMQCLIVIYSIVGCAMLWMTVADSNQIIVPLLVVGMAFGGLMGMSVSVGADAFGQKHLVLNAVILFFPFAVGAFFGPRLLHVMYAKTGSYSVTFIYASILGFIAAVLAFISVRIMSQRRQRVLAARTGAGAV